MTMAIIQDIKDLIDAFGPGKQAPLLWRDTMKSEVSPSGGQVITITWPVIRVGEQWFFRDGPSHYRRNHDGHAVIYPDWLGPYATEDAARAAAANVASMVLSHTFSGHGIMEQPNADTTQKP